MRFSDSFLLFLLLALVVFALVGCDDGSPAAPEDVAPVVHSPGGVRPYISPYSGKVGLGYDLGGGIVMSPTGKIGIGF